MVKICKLLYMELRFNDSKRPWGVRRVDQLKALEVGKWIPTALT